MDTNPLESSPVMVAAPAPPSDVAVQREPFFYPSSTVKLALLAPLTFNIYLLWWFWSQWRADAPDEGRGWSLLKTVLSGFFFYTMARQVKEKAVDLALQCRYSPAVLTVLLLADGLAIRLGGAITLIALALTGVLIVPVQTAINRVSWEVSRQKPRGWRWWEVAIAVVLGLFWALAIVGLLLPAPPVE